MPKDARWDVDDVEVRQHLTCMTTAISSKGQLILPASIRRRDHIESGQRFEIERLEEGQYRLTRLDPPRNEGLVALLLACPARGFFTPLPADSTADIQPPLA